MNFWPCAMWIVVPWKDNSFAGGWKASQRFAFSNSSGAPQLRSNLQYWYQQCIWIRSNINISIALESDQVSNMNINGALESDRTSNIDISSASESDWSNIQFQCSAFIQASSLYHIHIAHLFYFIWPTYCKYLAQQLRICAQIFG